MTQGHIAVIDIGKTNAKLALVQQSDLSEIAVITRPNTVLPGPPYPHFDVDGHWAFILDGLSSFQATHGIEAITITTHGASGALLAEDGSLAAPILDYEHDGPDSISGAYDAIRPAFSETGSPRLSMGLNLGAQMHWQLHNDPTLKDRIAHVVTYPQFWAHRLTGVLATDVTSLGCHTDLWNPFEARLSSLTETLNLADKIAPPRKPGDVLGPILPDIAQRTGLPAGIPVRCGIHDSNASLLPHLVSRKPPFSVLSTGTWVIAMAVGGKPAELDPKRDTLANVNAFGDVVPSARFMGGREYDLLLGGSTAKASETETMEALSGKSMILPAVVPETGPFAGKETRWIGTEPPIGSGLRDAIVSFYLALVSARCLELIGHDGAIIVEGPLARSTAYLLMLEAASSSTVIPMISTTGTSQGAALLAMDGETHELRQIEAQSIDAQVREAASRYARAWKAALSET